MLITVYNKQIKQPKLLLSNFLLYFVVFAILIFLYFDILAEAFLFYFKKNKKMKNSLFLLVLLLFVIKVLTQNINCIANVPTVKKIKIIIFLKNNGFKLTI